MKKYIYVENGIINGVGESKQLNEDVLNIEIDDVTFNEYIENPLRFAYSDGEIINNPNYEQEKRKQNAQLRIFQIDSELKELDEKRIRAICENEIKDEATGQTWLEFYNSQIQDLREERSSLALI